MFEGPRIDWLRRFSSEDVAATGIRIGLASAGPFGAILAEFVTQFVPEQRLDRLHDFAEQLAKRLTSLETAFEARIGESAAYASLVEQVTLAAVRAADRNRRRDLADLLRTGLSRTDAELLGHEALLRLLDRLNEMQIIVLISYAFQPTFNDPEYQAFAELHPGVFDLEPPTLGDSEDKLAPWALREHYELELKTLGLLENRTIAGSNEYTEITTMGQMLLAAIGRTPRRAAG